MKYIVTYSSKYGSTRKYAGWIADELSCDIRDLKNVQADFLKNYDVIIHGGGLYAGGVSGLSHLVKIFPKIRDKKLVLFTCGLADPASEKNVLHIENSIAKAILSEMNARISQFHFRGGIDYNRLSFVHRAMMLMLCQKMNKMGQDKLTPEDKLMLETYGKKIDFSDQKAIDMLIDYVRG